MTIGYTKNPEKHDVGKAAVQRAGQALKLEAQPMRSLVKRVDTDLEQILECPEFDEETRKNLLDVAKHFCERIDKTAIHASAILVTPDDIENYTPLEGTNSNDTSTGERKYIRAAAYTFHQLEAMGCLKLDILGLNTLDIMNDCLKRIGMTVDEIPMNDKETFETYAKGNLMGVFQMESNGMQGVAKQLHVSNFNDVAALVALFRPGPIDSGMLQQYIDGKNGAKVTYPCKAMEEITGNTYGVIVYQEQAMRIAMKMAGYSLGQADGLRKVIGRKEMTKIKQAVSEFIDACVNNGYTREVAETVANQIEAAGRYIFNKCLSGREYIYRNNTKRFKPTIAEMYKIKNDADYAKKTDHLDLHKKYKCYGYGYGFSMGDGKITMNRIVDITYSGILPVYVVTTESGRQVRCTMNHKIPTTKGIRKLSNITVGDSVYVECGYDKTEKSYNVYTEPQPVNARPGHCGFTYRSDGNSARIENEKLASRFLAIPCQMCGESYDESKRFEIHHVDHDRTNSSDENLMWLCNSCHKKIHYRDGRTKRGTKPRLMRTEKIVSIEYECTEDCYDVEMEAPRHNFVTGEGIVVCNSHAVSYAYLSYKTAYLKTHYPVEYMCAVINSKNKQEDVLKYLDELEKLGIKILPPDYSKGNMEWQVEDGNLRMGLGHIKSVGKRVYLGAKTWEDFAKHGNKAVAMNLIKAGAMDFLGKSRAWMVANLEDYKKKLEYIEHCKERIEYYTVNGKDKMRMQWEAKLKATEFANNAEQCYDNTKGEIEVLGMSFSKLPKVLSGIADTVQEFNDKNGRLMARIVFKTDYGEFKGLVFSSQWKKKSYYDKYKGRLPGIIVEQGKKYKFIITKGIVTAVKPL